MVLLDTSYMRSATHQVYSLSMQSLEVL